jgi:hypothetical protein
MRKVTMAEGGLPPAGNPYRAIGIFVVDMRIGALNSGGRIFWYAERG